MADPLDTEALQDLRFQTGMSVEAAVAPLEDISKTYSKHYYPKDVWW
jgi:hypothetical protein